MNSLLKYDCLIVEGGGFRTAFTTGILDAFQALKFDPFKKYIGISGGSIAVSYFLSSQYNMCYDAMRLLAGDEHFTQFKRTFGKEGYMDIDYLSKIAQEKVPFDLSTALHAFDEGKEIYFVATNRNLGNAEYLIPNADQWIDYVIASSTLPFVTKGEHKIGEVSYFDGGWSDPLPVKWAVNKGSKNILVLRTNLKDQKTTQSWPDYFGSLYFSSQPELSETFSKSYEHYNDAIDFMNSPPEGITIDQIAPDSILESGTYSYNQKTLRNDYNFGLALGLDFLMRKQIHD